MKALPGVLETATGYANGSSASDATYERARHPHFAVESKELENFFEAEQYHQDYLDKNPDGYCHVPLGVIKQLSQLTFDENYYK